MGVGSNPTSDKKKFSPDNLVVPARTLVHPWAVSVVVITSALHAEGRQFEPGTDQILFLCDSFESAAIIVKLLSFWPRHLNKGVTNIDGAFGYSYIIRRHGKLLHKIQGSVSTCGLMVSSRVA